MGPALAIQRSGHHRASRRIGVLTPRRLLSPSEVSWRAAAPLGVDFSACLNKEVTEAARPGAKLIVEDCDGIAGGWEWLVKEWRQSSQTPLAKPVTYPVQGQGMRPMIPEQGRIF